MRLSGTKATAIHQYRGLGNQLWDLAGNRPSLDLRFADSKSLVDATTGQNLIDFTRASSGTYVGSDGLIKTATTNLLLRSEEFDDASWVKQNGHSVTPNTAIAPDGTLTADTFNRGASNQYVLQPNTAVGTFTLSAWVRVPSGTRTFEMQGYNSTDGALGNTLFTATTEWQRFTITATNTTTTNWYPCVPSNFGVDFYVWGAQLEQSSTVGEYVKTTSTINSAPRFDHDPETGESLGLLVEESRTNLLSYSEEFNTWIAGNTTVTVDSSVVLAPDGTATADKVVENTGTGAHFVDKSITTAAETYTFSGFAKDAGRRYLTLQSAGAIFGSAFATFDLQTGVVSESSTFTPFITPYPNGWYRIGVTGTASAATATITFLLNDSGTGGKSRSYTGDGTSGLYLWGAQLEAGSFPTSYIPTEGSTVTRAADVASISGTNFSSWYRQDEGTFSYQWKVPSATAPCNIFSVSDETTNNRHQHYSENNSITIRTASSGVASNNGVGTSSADTFTRVSFGYGSGTTSASNNGTAITTSTQVIPVNITTAYLGASANGTVGEGTTLSRLTYWPARLPDETLQGITQ